MTHATHHMDGNSLLAYARLKPEALRAQITDILSLGIARTARELAAMTGADLVSVRARLSDGCNGPAPIFRKAVRVEEEGSACKVWAFGLAEVTPSAFVDAAMDAVAAEHGTTKEGIMMPFTPAQPAQAFTVRVQGDGLAQVPAAVGEATVTE